MECIIHYEQESKYSKLIPVNSKTFKKLLKAKLLREKHGGANHHEVQCNNIPSNFDSEKHGVHMEPCYKKFTMFISQSKKRKLSTGGEFKQRKSIRSNTDMFPNHCYFCKAIRKRVGGSFEKCHIISEKIDKDLLRRAIVFHDDAVLRVHLDNNVSLNELELQMHKSCYRQYVKPAEKFLSEKEIMLTKQEELPKNSESPCGSDNLGKVLAYIEDHVIKDNQSVSMAYLHELYGDGHAGDKRYRGKLKSRICKALNDQIIFVTADIKSPEILMNAQNPSTIPTDKQSIINLAADYIRADILKMSEDSDPTSWPPSIGELKKNDECAPHTLTAFYNRVLHPFKSKHKATENTKLLVNSFSSDLIHNVTKGEVITSKHFLLGTGLHNMTGQKVPINILSNLGHCISYKNICDVETAQAIVVSEEIKQGKNLKIQPIAESAVVTVYWADNFNMSRDTMGDNAFVNITTVVAFQEVNTESFRKEDQITLNKEESHISKLSTVTVNDIKINKRVEPRRYSSEEIVTTANDKQMQWRVYLWLFARMLSAEDQTFPSLSGWFMLCRSQPNKVIKKTETTYLPPLPTPITKFGTLHKLFEMLQESAASVNMPYVNLTLDVGAAINAYKLLWSEPSLFQNVMLHLADFHFMNENFCVIGVFLKNSGFEDIMFQAQLCTSGCLNGILHGSHYNRSWGVHAPLREALERLLVDLFKETYSAELPNQLTGILNGADVSDLLSLDEICSYFEKYETFKQDVRSGKYGKTAKFWLVYYIDIMNCQLMFHTSIQENNFEKRLEGWKFMLPYFLCTNKTNYSRYGSYYVFSLENIDTTYPGNKTFLENGGLSVQAQDRYNLRTPIDQRGEQTINRDGKVSGGLKLLRTDGQSMLKWTLNRARQAENTSALKSLANVDTPNQIYKHIRPSQIVKSEEKVQKLLNVLKTEFLNPFDSKLDGEKLYNLSSGIAVDDETGVEILGLIDKGKSAYEEFVRDRLQPDGNVPLHKELKRQAYKAFSSTTNKVTIVLSGKLKKQKTIEANRDVLGKLMATSAKHNRPIDFKTALTYQLTSVPLSLSHPDGSKRTTQKGQLIKIIQGYNSGENVIPRKEEVGAYIVDVIALLRTLGAEELPETFNELVYLVARKIPVGYKRVDFIVDTYLDNSFKNEERRRRGVACKVLISSEFSKIPRNFKDFLSNGENKTRLTELMLKVLKENNVDILSKLSSDVIYFSSYKECTKITKTQCLVEEHLSSNQEEADTKVMLHAHDVLSSDADSHVIIRSHSGDTDIIILALGLFIDDSHRVTIDSNTGQNRIIINLNNVNMSKEQKECLIGFHALTGNDYISAFFRKTKKHCWNALKTNHKFFGVIADIGKSWEATDELLQGIEQYICLVYGKKL